MNPENKRWFVQIDYRTNGGTLTVDYAIEEIEELHSIVEKGPNFYAIEEIRITIRHLNGVSGKTLEQLEAE